MKYSLFFVCLLLASCSERGSRTGGSLSGSASKSAADASGVDPETGPDRWEARENTATSGDIKIAIAQSGVELIHVEGVQDRTEVFVVRLEISNTSATKRHKYETWATNASLADSFGNAYKRLPRPRNMGIRDVPLNPTAPVTDTLIFESPITTASFVDLFLPGNNVGLGSGFRFRVFLHTSGQRLKAVTKAAAAVEAEAKAKAAAIASKEAAAKRAEEQRKEEYRLAQENAMARQKEADLAAEKARAETEKARVEAEKVRQAAEIEAEKLRQVAEVAALPGKLASAKTNLDDAKDKLRAIKAITSNYTWSGATMPDDYFIGKPKRYVYFGRSQKIARTKEVQDDIDRLTAEIANLEARIKANSK